MEQEEQLVKNVSFTVINLMGKVRKKTSSEVVEARQTASFVGTTRNLSLPEDEVKNLVLERPEL